MKRLLAAALIFLGWHGTAWTQAGIRQYPPATSPITAQSCMYVDQYNSSSNSWSNNSVCPTTIGGWATFFGISGTLPTLAGYTANNLHVVGNGTASGATAADVLLQSGTNLSITCSGSGPPACVVQALGGGAQYSLQHNNNAGLSGLGSLGTTTTVLHGNVSGLPTWSSVSLTTDIVGTLGVPNGGTGLTSLTAGTIPMGAGA